MISARQYSTCESSILTSRTIGLRLWPLEPSLSKALQALERAALVQICGAKRPGLAHFSLDGLDAGCWFPLVMDFG